MAVYNKIQRSLMGKCCMSSRGIALAQAIQSIGGKEGIIQEDIVIEGDYNLCAIDSEHLIVSPSSLATLSIGTIRLTPTPPSSVHNLCSLANESLTVSPSSVYDLSQVAP